MFLLLRQLPISTDVLGTCLFSLQFLAMLTWLCLRFYSQSTWLINILGRHGFVKSKGDAVSSSDTPEYARVHIGYGFRHTGGAFTSSRIWDTCFHRVGYGSGLNIKRHPPPLSFVVATFPFVPYLPSPRLHHHPSMTS